MRSSTRLLKPLLFLFLLSFAPYAYGKANQNVLVTGGAGYIGSHACKALKESGFNPVVFDSLVNGEKRFVKWGPFFKGDLLDAESLDQVFTKYKPVAVLHFAALRNVRESLNNPMEYYTNNISGSVNLLNAMRNHQVKYIIFASSGTVYGDVDDSAISENCPKNPTNPYSMSKAVVERLIEDYSRAYEFKYVVLRYFNASGIDIKSGLSRPKKCRSFLIPRAIHALLKVKEPLEIFGSNYNTPDGTCIRDYIHVKDLASAHVASLQYLLKGGSSDVFNLGSGTGTSVMEVVDMINSVTGKLVPYRLKSASNADLSQTVADIKKAQKVLNFKPIHSGLRSIVEGEWVSLKEAQ